MSKVCIVFVSVLMSGFLAGCGGSSKPKGVLERGTDETLWWQSNMALQAPFMGYTSASPMLFSGLGYRGNESNHQTIVDRVYYPDPNGSEQVGDILCQMTSDMTNIQDVPNFEKQKRQTGILVWGDGNCPGFPTSGSVARIAEGMEFDADGNATLVKLWNMADNPAEEAPLPMYLGGSATEMFV